MSELFLEGCEVGSEQMLGAPGAGMAIFNHSMLYERSSILASTVPVAVTTSGVLSGKFITQVAGSALSACAIDSGGKAYCWGSNTIYGQLGNGSLINSFVPVAVTTSGALSGVTLGLITAGAFNGCATSTAGASYCWGNNADGEFGSNNFTTPSTTAVATYTGGVLSGHPAKGDDATLVMGVNQDEYQPGAHTVVSNGSCTTNCLAPVALVLQRRFGLKWGMLSTVHSYTNSQSIHDRATRDETLGEHRPLRRAA